MKNFSMIFECVQAFLSKDEINSILEDLNYKDTSRKLDVQSLLHHWIAASIDGWASFRDSEIRSKSCDLNHVDFSTFSKKAKDVPFEFFKRAFSLILSKSNRSVRRAMASETRKIIAVDSTTMTFGKSKLPWAKYHGEKSGVKLHIHYDVASEMPVKAEESTGLVHDSAVSKYDTFEGAILVKDRAYTDMEVFDIHKSAKQQFVVRLRNNSKFMNKKSLQKLSFSDSNVYEDFTCILGTAQNHSSERHRVVFFKEYSGKEIRVCTNMMNISAEVIAEIYKARWQIEVFFKWIKQNLNAKRIFGTTPNAVYGQLYSSLIAYLIIKIMHVFSLERARVTEYSFIDFYRNLASENLCTEWVCLVYAFLRSPW